MNKKCLAALLALALLAGCVGLLPACSAGKDDGLSGNWTATLDFTDRFKEFFAGNRESKLGELAGDLDLDAVFDLSNLSAVMTWEMTLGRDGSVTMTVDGRQLVDSVDQVVANIKDNLVAAAPAVVEATLAQRGMTVAQAEAALAAAGSSLDDMVNDLVAAWEADFDGQVTAPLGALDAYAVESGYYVVDGDRLYLLDNKDDRSDQSDWVEFERTGNQLVVTDLSAGLKALLGPLDDMGISLSPSPL